MNKCFNDIMDYLEQDISQQFHEFVGIADEYSIAIDMFHNIINDIHGAANIFADSVITIKGQMNTVQLASNENEVGVDEIVAKNERTNVTAETLTDVLQSNHENMGVIQNIIESFMESNTPQQADGA